MVCLTCDLVVKCLGGQGQRSLGQGQRSLDQGQIRSARNDSLLCVAQMPWLHCIIHLTSELK